MFTLNNKCNNLDAEIKHKGKQMKEQITLYLCQGTYGKPIVSAYDMTDHGFKTVSTKTIEVEFELFDDEHIKQKQIEAVEQTLKNLESEHEKRRAEITAELTKLRANDEK